MAKPRKRAVLPVVFVFLALSAGLRIGGGVQTAMASEDSDKMASESVVDKNPETADTTALLEAFAKRQARLDTQEEQIGDRMKALELADRQLAEKLASLVAAEKALSATIAQAESAAKTDVSKLAVVYQNMKPKAAAALFEQMSPSFAAGFFSIMEPASAANIMTALSPEKAYAFSVILAGRNANVPIQ